MEEKKGPEIISQAYRINCSAEKFLGRCTCRCSLRHRLGVDLASYLAAHVGTRAGQLAGAFLRRGNVDSDGAQSGFKPGDASAKVAHAATDLGDVAAQQSNFATHPGALRELLAGVPSFEHFGQLVLELGHGAAQPSHPQSFVFRLVATSAVRQTQFLSVITNRGVRQLKSRI